MTTHASPTPEVRTDPVSGPVMGADRIQGLDVSRGLALFGILVVNSLFFGLPLGYALDHKPPPGSSTADSVAFHIIKIIFEANFFTIFSTLFGVGLAIQLLRAQHAGRGFIPRALRRLFFLLALGASHALFLWVGDILFMYAVAGLVTLPLLYYCRGRTLIIIGACVLTLATFIIAAMGLLTAFENTVPKESLIPDASLPQVGTPFSRWWDMYKQGGPSPISAPSEIEVYSKGPYRDLFLVRAVSWLSFLIFSAFSFGWFIVAMFLVGMGLVKSGFFDPSRAELQKRVARTCVGLGLPVALASGVAYAFLPKPAGPALGGLLMPGHCALAVGIISLTCAHTHDRRLTALPRWLACAGRTALSVYLLETIICTPIFYFYGLGLHGRLGTATLFAIAIGVYCIVLAFAVAWQSRFLYGPVEWVWRVVTYLRPQPFLRAREAPSTTSPR
jgi:uncharacterized protein